MAAINNVNNNSDVISGGYDSGVPKDLNDIIRKKKVENDDASTALPCALAGYGVQQNLRLYLSLASSGNNTKSRSDNSVFTIQTSVESVKANRSPVTELAAEGLNLKTEKPAERNDNGEIKLVIKEPALTKSSFSDGGSTNSENRASIPVSSGGGNNLVQENTSSSVVEQELRDISDKSPANRHDLTVMHPQQGVRLAEVKEGVVARKDSQQIFSRNAEGAGTGGTGVKEPVSASSNLTYNFSEWGSGHRVNVQFTTHHGMPLVLNPSDKLVQDRLADQGGQDGRGQPLWIFEDEQEQQQSRGNKPPKYAEE